MLAKADTMTPEEVAHFKKQIMNQIVQSKIKIYEFPDCEEGETEENERRENARLKERVPFAVVGSNTVIESAEAGKKVRGRKYPWGVVDVSDEQIRSDLLRLIEGFEFAFKSSTCLWFSQYDVN